jgi:hypothetical protein
MQKIGEGNSKVIKSKSMSDLIVTPVPSQKKRSLSFFLKVVPFVLLTVIALLVGFYYYRTKFNKPKTYRDLRVVNVAKLKKANYQYVEAEELISQVSEDCKPLGEGENISVHFDSAKSRLLKSAGVSKENYSGLVVFSTRVENSNNCHLTWLLDKEGDGLVGYEDVEGKFQIFRSRLSPEEIRAIISAEGFDGL